MKKKGFTLAEVLITLAIIGVVAAIAIPSVISNTQQQEFKTGLRKAVSVLNSAITMNMAIDGETPYDNANLMGYLMRHMSVMKTGALSDFYWAGGGGEKNYYGNDVFYTTDGMRFEFYRGSSGHHYLHENPIKVCIGATSTPVGDHTSCGGGGSFWFNNNSHKTTKPPFFIVVYVYCDNKPKPQKTNCKTIEC